MSEHLPKLNNHLKNNRVEIEMFASNWIFTLFTNSIPTEVVHYFLIEFFKFGWPFFYRFSLTILKILSSKILKTDADDEIMEIIKAPMKMST
jgi:Rab-GTPase-TBC domain